jgi:hypothetical protein
MIRTKFRSSFNHGEFYERVMPYPVRVGDFVNFDEGGVTWEVTLVEWVIEQNPYNPDDTHCTLNVRMK